MENNKMDDDGKKKEIIIRDKNGLNMNFDKDELSNLYPHLMKEIKNKEKTLKIDSYKMKIEQNTDDSKSNKNTSIPNELVNPGPIDFIRRCSKNEEAIEILDYLLKKKEISSEEYNKLKGEIMMDGGLKDLIERSGGKKNSGYYVDKYYKKNNTNQKLKSNKN